MANLITMFEDVELYLDVRSVRDYIRFIDEKSTPNDAKSDSKEIKTSNLPKLVALLKDMAIEQNIYEKVEADLKLLETEAERVYQRFILTSILFLASFTHESILISIFKEKEWFKKFLL